MDHATHRPTTRPFSTLLRRLTAAATTAVVVSVPSAGSALTVTPATPAHRPSPFHPAVNPHLHGVARPADVLTKAEAVRHELHTRWAHHWDSYAWFALHRGTGVIQGTVTSPQGRPLAGMDVRLRDWWGHPLHSTAAKHITTTGPGGSFVMAHVRVGRYRVRAAQGSKSGHAMVVLHAGQIAQVGVKV